jgi:hypothetical protein
VLGE